MQYDYIQCGDCLELMQNLPDKSINFILCDLPYGTSACRWDSIIPFEPLWRQYERIITDNGAIALFGSEPFTSRLITSNLPLYKYSWVWIKDNAPNFLNKRYQPGKITEDICIFGKMATSYSKKGNMIYNPQLEEGTPYTQTNWSMANTTNAIVRSVIHPVTTVNTGTRLPNNILRFTRDKDKLHPTQKPVALLEYLIKTYTNPNDIVLDNCVGSGSTCIAAINTNRHYIGFELDPHYFNIAQKRINATL